MQSSGCGEVREVELAVLEVVQAGDRRLEAGDHHLAQHLEALLHVLQRPAEEDVVLGQVREQLHRHLGDVAEGALVADHDVADVGAGGAARHVLDARHLAAGEHDLAADDHVLDAAVERGELADAAGGDEAAHRRDRLALRRVAGGETDLAHLVLERLQRHTALHGGLHVVGVDLHDLVRSPSRRPRSSGSSWISRPPSVAVPPVRATTFTPLLVGEGEHLGDVVGAAHHAPRPPASGRVYTPKMFCSLRKLSTLRALQHLGVGDHLLGGEELLEVFDDGVTGEGHDGSVLGAVRVRSVEDRVGALEQRVGVAADVVVHGVGHPAVHRAVAPRRG